MKNNDLQYQLYKLDNENEINVLVFAKIIDEFLQFRRYKILTSKGRISMQNSKNKF